MAQRRRRPAHAERVLHPSGGRLRTPLPGIVPVLAIVGLVVLVFCTLPAVLEHQELEREHALLEQKAREAQDALERRRRELKAGQAQQFPRIKATRALLSQGKHYLEKK